MTRGIPERTRASRSAWTALILVALGFAASGCVFDSTVNFGRLVAARCPMGLYRYGASRPPAPPKGIVRRLGSAYAAAWASLRPGTILYADRGLVARQVPAALKGATLLRLPAADRDRQESATDTGGYLHLALASAGGIDHLWVAFDTRASRTPDWLRAAFEPVEPEAILVSSEVAGPGGVSGHVRYRVWRPKAGHLTYLASDRTLGGNDASGTAWKGAVGSQYLVLVRLHPTPDRSTRLEKIADLRVEVGFRSRENPPRVGDISPFEYETAKLQALRRWLARPSNAAYRQAYFDGLIGLEGSVNACSVVERTVGGTARPLRAPDTGGDRVFAAWERRSEGELSAAASSATVVVDGQAPVTIPLEGRIDFMLLGGGAAEIANLDLWGRDATLADGTPVRGITVTQMAPFPATCADGLPPAEGRLCTRYTVPAGGVYAGVVLDAGGAPLAGTLVNDSPVALDVDLDAGTFSFAGGPLTATVEAGGTTRTARVVLALEGTFTNLAPVADIAETPRTWECGDGGVADVVLSAAASTDELDPADVALCRWIEDRGTLAERWLGDGTTLTVPLGYGVHDLILLVRDTHGADATREFQLVVTDSRIDTIQVPPDRWVPVTDPAGTPVAVGTATASDLCSGHVVITSDAPVSGRFPLGFTPVTWTFDDERGNVVRRIQRIFVLEPAFESPPVPEITLPGTTLAPGDPLDIALHVLPRGRGMLLDVWVLLRGPDGDVWSFDGSGALAHGVSALAARANLGVADTTLPVHAGPLSDPLEGPGAYRLEAYLTVPGGGPDDRTTVVGFDERPLVVTGP